MGWFSKADDDFFLCTLMPTPEMARIQKTLGLVHGEAVIGANIFRDLFSSVRDVVGGRAGGYERALSGARDAALKDLIEAAKEADDFDAYTEAALDIDGVSEDRTIQRIAMSSKAGSIWATHGK